ncbi:NYN domain-containing protein [Arthrobacter sp. B10-11]|uniref:NYN domain-containing protein n=1 Tax=Arthrobacter sp. B10-11 TaxID=3081160 RepID=UPI002955B1FC|nr:NYN domain-containing protein [Arthrobacter sp. B10-11]MDV8149969.1 NYN domain-containing protein [Arthrobacter sp. B10-11]
MAIFLDMENLFGGYKNDVTSVPLAMVVRDIEKVVRDTDLGGRTALTRAYANWARADMAGYRSQLLAHNIKPVQIFSFDQSSKNAADIELVVDALEVAADMPWIDLFVIVSGDGDFVPLLRRLHALGKRSLVATTSQPKAGAVNKVLQSVADHFHVIDIPAPPAAAAAVGKPAKKKNEAPHTELELYKASVHAFLKDDATLWEKGLVNVARLGHLLRDRWPNVTYKTFGYKTLTSFAEEGCGLKVISTPAAGPKARAKV